MKTFIQVTEIWTPNRDRTLLEFHDGLYGDHPGFGNASRKMCFGYDEGLPGHAWAERRPVILQDLQHSYFMRAEAARKSGLTCGVAIPVFAGEFLLAVLVFFCGDDADHVGAIELWHNNPAKSSSMGLVEGYFGIAESFRFTAQNTQMMRGFGLPGMVWESGMPEILEDLGHSKRFLRRDDARKVGINKGLGIPSMALPGQHYVMTFLSALGTPIARRFEIWVPDQLGAALKFRKGECDRNPRFAEDYAGLGVQRDIGLLGRVWTSGVPAVSASIADEISPVGTSARKAELASMVAIPVLDAGRTKAIVAMYF